MGPVRSPWLTRWAPSGTKALIWQFQCRAVRWEPHNNNSRLTCNAFSNNRAQQWLLYNKINISLKASESLQRKFKHLRTKVLPLIAAPVGEKSGARLCKKRWLLNVPTHQSECTVIIICIINLKTHDNFQFSMVQMSTESIISNTEKHHDASGSPPPLWFLQQFKLNSLTATFLFWKMRTSSSRARDTMTEQQRARARCF